MTYASLLEGIWKACVVHLHVEFLLRKNTARKKLTEFQNTTRTSLDADSHSVDHDFTANYRTTAHK
jgi:hypothetical protein